MIALIVLIAMCLVFFTLYEQTYGSWVTFTDRMLTKDVVPSLVHAAVVWTRPALPLRRGRSSRCCWRRRPSWWRRRCRTAIRTRRRRSCCSCWRSRRCWCSCCATSWCCRRPAGSLTYLGALFIVLLAPLFSVLWGWLDRRGLDPSKPVKIGARPAARRRWPSSRWRSAAQQAGASGAMASVWWLVLAYFVLELGEMCLSPVGLSAVTQLSVPTRASA